MATKAKPLTKGEQAAAIAESLKELARRELHQFVQQAWHVIEPEQPFADNWHIEAICKHLEAVTAGKIPQLLVNVPPGTMKSLLVGVFWPAWVWIAQPGKRFMSASYAEALSMRDAMRMRDLVQSQWYQTRWPMLLKADQNTKGRFDNSKGGWRLVASITGKGIGEHPDFFIGDDLHNVLQAESDAERANVLHWFEGVFCVRGEVRDVKRVLVMQRLHALDCSGLALSKGGWTHLCFPMEFEGPDEQGRPRMPETCLGFRDPRRVDGDLLWPAKYPRGKVENMKVNMGLYGSAGQLQQRPSPRGGGMFQRDWFVIVSVCPTLVKLVRYFDKAGTRGGGGAQTAGVLMAEYVDETAVLAAQRNKWIVLDVLTCREQAAQREAIIKQTGESDRAKWGHVETWVEQEPGSGGLESAQNTVANLAGFVVKVERVTGSKEVRAEPLASQASVGKVRLLAGAWNASFLEELEQFPMGKLKDQVDAASGAFNKMFVPSGAARSAADIFVPPDTSGDALDYTVLDVGELG